MSSTSLRRMVAVVAFFCLPGWAVASEFVVDPGGDDGNLGSMVAPWRTVGKAAASVQAGDSVTINPGTYQESVWLATSGQPDAPIVFRAEPGAVFVSPDPSASVEAIDIAGASYIQLLGIEATGGYHETIFVRSGSHHIDIANCQLHGNRLGILLADAHDVTVSGCSLHHNIRAGIRFAGSTHDVVISDTESFGNDDGNGCAGEADGFAADSSGHVSNITFVRVKAYDNSEDGFDLPVTNVLLDQIESRNNCGGLKLWSSATLRNCVVRGNHRGIGTTSVTGNTTVTVSNCTVADNLLGLDLKGAFSAKAYYKVNLFNNIVVGPDRALDFAAKVILSETHNIFWRNNLYAAHVQIVSPTGVPLRRFTGHDINLGVWRIRMRQGPGTFAINPWLTDPANGDLSPLPFSPAVERAQPNDLTSDYLGTARPQGAGPDIGAIEILDPAANHIPIADAGLSRYARVWRRVLFGSAGSVDPDGDVLAYSWDFGDGSPPATGARAFHIFMVAGTYTVTLTASDGSLSDQAKITVVVY